MLEHIFLIRITNYGNPSKMVSLISCQIVQKILKYLLWESTESQTWLCENTENNEIICNYHCDVFKFLFALN